MVSGQGGVPGARWREPRKFELVVEAVDDAREVYFGGQKVGSLGEFPPAYRSGLGETKRLAIPAGAIKFGGENVVAIRVATIESRNGFNVAAPVLFAGDEAIRLAGKWETANGDDVAWANSEPAAIKTAAFAKIEDAAVVEQELKKLSDDDGPLSPAESLARMKTPDDLQVELVLVRAAHRPAAVDEVGSPRPAVGRELPAVSQPGRPEDGQPRQVPAERLRQGSAAAAEPFSAGPTRSRSTKTPTATASSTSTRRFSTA